MQQLPIVDYLVLGDDPHLVVRVCTSCDAPYFDRRNGCAQCPNREFTTRPVANEGTVRAFTIVTRAGAGIEVPHVAVIVDCDGTLVNANLVNIPPDADHIRTGMPVRMTTRPMGVDARGIEAVAFGYEPTNTTSEV